MCVVPRLSDLTWRRFGRLVAIHLTEKRGKHNAWLCRCDCGKLVTVLVCNLITGNTKSCGCWKRELVSEQFSTHKDARPTVGKVRLYQIWCGIMSRCYNPHRRAYPNYGGRGVVACDEWRTYENFKAWALSSGYTDELSIERVDPNGDYEPSNCTWIPKSEQSRNTRSNRWLEYKGERKILADWGRTFNMPEWTLRRRIKKYGTEQAFIMAEQTGRRGVEVA